MSKKILLGLVFLIGAFLMVRSFYQEENRSIIYKKGLIDKIETLNPRRTRARADYIIAKAILGQWLQYDIGTKREVKPAALKAWAVNPRGDEFTFTVRPDVFFHSGKRLTADDLIFSIHFFAHKDSLMQYYFRNIVGFDDYLTGKETQLKGVEKISAMQVKIKLASPSFVFLINFADPKITVLPVELNHIPAQDFFKKPDGIGPFLLESFTEDGGRVQLQRNENYYAQKSDIKTYEMEVLKKDEAIFKFNNGDLHDLVSFQIEDQDHGQINQKNSVHLSASAYSSIIVFLNGTKKKFKGLANRKALQSVLKTIDYGKICNHKLIKATGFFPKGMTGWLNPDLIPELKTSISDHDKKNRGTSGKGIQKRLGKKLRLLSYGNENKKCMIDGMIAGLKEKLKIQVEHLQLNEKSAVDIFHRDGYDLFLEHLSVRTKEPYHFITYFDPLSSHNLTKFKDDKISTIVDLIRGTPAPSLRSQLYRKLDEYLSIQQSYIIPLSYDVRNYYFSSKVLNAKTLGLLDIHSGLIGFGY